jgi:hypothetical protein
LQKKGARLSTMCQKQKVLAMKGKNLAKIYIIEIKAVSLSSVAGVMEREGGEKLWKTSLTY